MVKKEYPDEAQRGIFMSTNRIKLTFFDDYWVDYRPGTTRRWFAPECYSRVPSTLGYGSMFYDPAVGKYKLYYETLRDMANDDDRVLKLLESDDLRTFTQVLADDGSDVIVDYNGHVHGAAVLYDPKDPDPARRYKRFGMYGIENGGKGWMCPAFSADGIHWQDCPDIVMQKPFSDAGNYLFYNPCYDDYTAVLRSAWCDRRIALRTSPDCEHWSEPRTVLHPAGQYNNEATHMEHYSMAARWFDGIFYAVLWRFTSDIRRLPGMKPNCGDVSEPELVYSYDGREFLQTTGKPLMERPLAPMPGWAGLAPVDICESADGQYYYLLCIGYSFIHGSPESNKRLHQLQQERGISSGHLIYRIRKDSFCGLESVAEGGMVYSGLLELLDDDLSFNVRADCGSVRFGICGGRGIFLDGFSLDDCIPFEYSSGTEIVPRWKEHSLKEILGRRVRIVVELNGAILHSISATARPHILQRQKSFNDPQGL